MPAGVGTQSRQDGDTRVCHSDLLADVRYKGPIQGWVSFQTLGLDLIDTGVRGDARGKTQAHELGIDFPAISRINAANEIRCRGGQEPLVVRPPYLCGSAVGTDRILALGSRSQGPVLQVNDHTNGREPGKLVDVRRGRQMGSRRRCIWALARDPGLGGVQRTRKQRRSTGSECQFGKATARKQPDHLRPAVFLMIRGTTGTSIRDANPRGRTSLDANARPRKGERPLVPVAPPRPAPEAALRNNRRAPPTRPRKHSIGLL